MGREGLHKNTATPSRLVFTNFRTHHFYTKVATISRVRGALSKIPFERSYA